MSKILITGGAGYIGSHAVFHACMMGKKVVIIDNLFRGYKQCIESMSELFPNQIAFYNIDLRQKSELEKVFDAEKEIKSVLHFAALCSVNESMENPYLYFENNTFGTANLLEVMKNHEVNKIVFSSTCATYQNIHNPTGDFSKYAVDENTPQKPESPYGESKVLSEKEIFWYEKLFGLNYTILRYFNVCGAQSDGKIGDSKKPSLLLMQNAVRGALKLEPFKFTFSETSTPDGSPIRDYINIEDLVDAHFAALEKMQETNKSAIYNVGTGQGTSVKEIVNKVMEITGIKFEIVKGEPRQGEAPAIYANNSKINTELGWSPIRSVEDSITSLMKWYQGHPSGWEY